MRDWILHNLSFVVPAVVVLVGLGVYGLRDLLVLSPRRIWAISDVCFRDAIRRRVLWVTPLAMLGVIIISLLQKPVDQPDAIRQTIKFCFFASALVVTIIALITAATNLPREIESRVIYTIVTKPVTRLDIVLGKIVGFARVSAAMLLIMGIFTLGYLQLRAWYLGRQIAQTLESPQVSSAQREWLEHFQQQGLLFSQTIHRSNGLSQYATDPAAPAGSAVVPWILGGAQDAIAEFVTDSSLVEDPKLANATYRLVFNIPFSPTPKAPVTPAGATPPEPEIQVVILDPRTDATIVRPEQLAPPVAPKPGQEEAPGVRAINLATNPSIEIPRPIMEQLTRFGPVNDRGRFNVQIVATNPAFLYQITKDAVTLEVTTVENGKPVGFALASTGEPQTRGSTGRFGQQLRGAENGLEPLAVFRFNDVPVPESQNGEVPFELKVGIERSGSDSDTDDATVLEVRIHDRKADKLSEPKLVYPESKRTAFFTMPADFLTSGQFDVIVRNRTGGSVVGLLPTSLQLVSDRELFGINLFKGLFVLWLFSLLVAIVAFFCSTFLSWPIAVVLSLLIILGRWAAMNLDLGSGFGAEVATGVTDPRLANVVSKSVDALTGSFSLLASVLPDISGFAVTEQIERGATITLAQLASPVFVLVLFGLPLMTLAYVFLRNKEVAP